MHLKDYLEPADGRRMPKAVFAKMVGKNVSTVHRWVDGTLIPGPAALLTIYRVTNGAVRPDDMILVPDAQEDAA